MSTTKYKQDLDVTGNITLSGNVTADGNVILGDADTDSITLNADITSSIIPDDTNTYDLGATGKNWRNLWISNDITVGANLLINGTVTSTTDITLQAGTGVGDRVEISQSPLKLASITTVNRDAKTSENGDMIYNSTTNQYEVYENGTWRSLATDANVTTEVAALVDSAPATLDTLNELAAALGDDPNFATTMTTSLAGKEPTITAGTATQYYRGDKSFQTLDTLAVAENTNLYYTDARVRAAVSATTGSAGYNSSTGAFSIPANTSHVTESGNLYYTDARADARIANNIIDEDNMATDSATRAPSQQSVKAYVDANSGGGGLGSVIEFGAISGGIASTSTTRDFSMPIVVAPGQTVAGWSSYEAAPAIAWRDNYQGSPTVLGTTTYTNSTGSNVTVYARANTTNSNVVGAHYMLFG